MPQHAPPPPSPPSADEVRDLVAEVRRALAHLEVAGREGSPLAIRRAILQAAGPARRVLEWGQGQHSGEG